MGAAFKAGMVLVLSIWDDYAVNMLWLDSTYPTTDSASTPGAARGNCSTTSGAPADVESSAASAAVIYSNIKYGPIGSTFSSTGTGTGTGTGGSSTASSPPTSTSSAAGATQTKVRLSDSVDRTRLLIHSFLIITTVRAMRWNRLDWTHRVCLWLDMHGFQPVLQPMSVRDEHGSSLSQKDSYG